MPGLGGNADQLGWLAAALAQRGWWVVVLQHPGSDGPALKASLEGLRPPPGAESVAVRLADAQAVLQDAHLAAQPKFVLGGGSNLVLTGDVKPLVLKVEVMGCAVVQETPKAYIVEAGAGENWHDFVAWTLAQGLPGLENMALICRA